MRITGGVARGRVLRGAIGPGIRPTGARMREAWFSIVGQDLTGVRFLDAFAGSGLMGLEAWSRGAEVVAVEKDRRHARAVIERAAELGAALDVKTGDLRRLAPSLGTFDLIYADPPYDHDPNAWLPLLATLCTGTLWYEADRRTAVPTLEGWIHHDERAFGEASLHAWTRP